MSTFLASIYISCKHGYFLHWCFYNGGILAEVVAKLAAKISELQRKYDGVKISRWSAGSYCVLANGPCPVGFLSVYGYRKAIYLYGPNIKYIW